MSVLVDHQPINWAPGSRSAQAVVSGGQTLIVRIARQTTLTPTFWPVSVFLAVDLDYSNDGGATWRENAGFESPGGITLDRLGNEATESVMEGPLPAGTNRLRVRAEVSGGNLVSQLTVESV